MELIFTDKAGRKRHGVYKTCPICLVEFITRTDQPQMTCSAVCKHKSRENRECLECCWCKKQFESTISKNRCSRSGLRFCSRNCKDQAQRLGGLKEIMPDHYGTGQASYREVYQRHNPGNLKCSRCNYCEFECGVDIHHIDENRDNNSVENLISLCSPCHKALHCGLWKLEEI